MIDAQPLGTAQTVALSLCGWAALFVIVAAAIVAVVAIDARLERKRRARIIEAARKKERQ